MSVTALAAHLEYFRPAILDRILDGGHKIIDASAGTGKTFTIERIVVELLLTGAATIDQILVVTFTEKATAELRARIRTTIEDVISGRGVENARPSDRRPLGGDQRERLKSALFSFHHAPIHTIHSFCHRMLTELAFDSGVRFGLDLASGRHQFHEAVRAELRDELKSDSCVKRLVGEWLSDDRRTSDSLEDLLWRAHSQRYLRTAGRELNQKALTDLANTFDAKMLAGAYELAAITDDARLDALAATGELKSIIDHAAGSTALLAENLCDFELGRICDPKSARRVRTEKRPFFPEQMPDRVRAIINTVQRVQAALAIEQRVVDELLMGVVNRMDARKRERGTLDYEDMLAWLADALDGARGKSLATTLRERYRVILIDEFQDTDELQWKIFRRVFVEGGGNLVYVIGDPKQAIYGFRGADVHAYLEAREQLSTSGAATVTLRENFRSTADTIEACDLIFEQKAVPSLFTGKIQYDPPAECGRPALRAVAANGNSIAPVTLVKFAPRGERHKFSRRMREAIGLGIAHAIRRIIEEPDRAIKICDEGHAPRKITAREIYVLTRTNRDSVEIAKHLRQAGVPFAFYKQDGLFQTREASYVLDVLRGIDEPGRRSNRLKACASPFFAVDYSDLGRLDDDRNAQPILDRLFEWRALAEAERFAELFDALLHESGLAERQLLLSDGGRQLTNFEHIFEILTRDASRRGVSLAEIIDLLDAYIAERATPSGDDPNIQRIEDDRDAVQIMTIHKSKGLEADVVALYGGFFANTQPDLVSVYHCGNERRLAIGKPARDLADDEIKQERAEDDQRLLYVALTRARAKLILPCVPSGSLNRNRDLTGFYKPLNDRLRTVECESLSERLFVTEIAIPPSTDSESEHHQIKPAFDENALCNWLESTSQPVTRESEFPDLAAKHRGLIVESYTSLQAAEPDDFKTSVDAIDARADSLDLPGGRHVGIFLHEAIEKLDFKSFGDAPDLRSWMARDEVRELFAKSMRRHGVNDPRWLDRGREIVFNTLTSRVALGETMLEGGLCSLEGIREMEFAYPIPERRHTLLGDGPDGAWTVGRGYIKGFIDLVFRRDNLMYFADWKGDLLPSYEPAAVARHVESHYRLQARIYSVGVVRLLAIHNERDYDSRFGGLLYVFLRGVSRSGDGKIGFYFERPSWNEIVTYESELMNHESDAELIA
ncbi:MAG: UvrD-helicase domain-containing protein [Candidatus Binatus sp.]|uniref:UvrD-helicase domain-containing protein n=1 Tax=Candidatus Binatus sp. TaxID=2811406 RepID=UPI003BAF76BB